MSDRRLTATLLVALPAALLATSVLPAQQRNEALETRRTMLSARVDSLRQALKAQEMAERDGNLTAEVRVGAVRIRTTEGLQAVAAAAIAEAIGQSRAALGSEVDSLAGRLQLTLREQRTRVPVRRLLFDDAAPRIIERPTSALLDVLMDGGDGPGFTLKWPVEERELTQDVMTLFESMEGRRLREPAGAWLSHRVPLRRDTPTFWTELYRQTATSDASASRRCIAGDRAACRLAFALDSMPENRLSAWYDESDFPSLVRTEGTGLWDGWNNRSLTAEEREDCTERRRLDICARILREMPTDQVRLPMPVGARSSLTRVALETGGPASLNRLRASVAPTIGGQLADAAGVPVDSLVGLWQRRVAAERPRSPLPNAGFVIASMACIVVCGVWSARGQPWK